MDDAFQALGDELLGDADLEGVEPLDLPGFDGERPSALLKPLVEKGAGLVAILEAGANGGPLLAELRMAGHKPTVRTVGHARERAPDFRLSIRELHNHPPRA